MIYENYLHTEAAPLFSLHFRGAAKDLPFAAVISCPGLWRYLNPGLCLADVGKGWAKPSHPIPPLTPRSKFGNRSPLLFLVSTLQTEAHVSRAAPKYLAWFSSTEPGHNLQAEG